MHGTSWSALHAAQLLDISGGGSANFVQLTFWAQTSAAWSGERYVDVALFARQAGSGGSNASAMTPMAIFRIKFASVTTSLLSLPAGSNPVSDATGLSGPKPWYMASRLDFSLPLGTGSQLWPAQNPAQAILLQQNAASGWVQIPLRGYNQIAIATRVNATGDRPGRLLVARKLR